MTATRVNDAKLQPGNVVYYIMRDEQRPVNPFYQWPGKIIRVDIGKPGTLNGVWVESLEPGYEGCCEYVLLEQIVRIELAPMPYPERSV